MPSHTGPVRIRLSFQTPDEEVGSIYCFCRLDLFKKTFKNFSRDSNFEQHLNCMPTQTAILQVNTEFLNLNSFEKQLRRSIKNNFLKIAKIVKVYTNIRKTVKNKVIKRYRKSRIFAAMPNRL